MKKLLYILLLFQNCIMTAQIQTGISPYGEKIPINPYSNNGIENNAGYTQLGGALIKPSTISTTDENTLSIKGLPISSNINDVLIVTTADGTLKTGTTPPINIAPAGRGTVLAIDGKLEVAQEITTLMTSSFTVPNSSTSTTPVPNLSILIDNKNTFVGNSTTNSFKVSTNGVYLININVSFYNFTSSGNSAIGVWCDNDNNWVARTSLYTNSSFTRRTLTLITAISMLTTKTYSFRISTTSFAPLTVEASNTTSTEGNGPIGLFSLKRLK